MVDVCNREKEGSSKPQAESQTPNGVRGDRRSRSTKDSGAVVGGVVGAVDMT